MNRNAHRSTSSKGEITMIHSSVLRTAVTAAATLCLITTGVQAATITFTDDGDYAASLISTAGTLVEAINFDDEANDATTTVNTVVFEDYYGPNDNGDYNNEFKNNANDFDHFDFEPVPSATGGRVASGYQGNKDPDEDLDAGGANFDSIQGADDSATQVTLTGLTSGMPYVFQLVTADNDDGTYDFYNNGDTSGTAALSVDLGKRVITGTFEADASTQIYSFDRPDSGRGFVLGAVQLREIPEPATLVLFGLGGLMFARRRRNA